MRVEVALNSHSLSSAARLSLESLLEQDSWKNLMKESVQAHDVVYSV